MKKGWIIGLIIIVYLIIPIKSKALTLTQEVTKNNDWWQFSYTKDNTWYELYNSQGYYKEILNATAYTQLTLQGFYMQPNPSWDNKTFNDWYEIFFAFSEVKPDLYQTTLEQNVCDQYSLYEDVSIGGTPRDSWACTNAWDNVIAQIPHEIYNTYNPASMIVNAVYNGGNGVNCIVNTDTNSILCPTKRSAGNAGGTITKITITFPFSKVTSTSNSSFYFLIQRYANTYMNASSGGSDYTTQITGIQNSLDDVDSSIQDVNSTLNQTHTYNNNASETIGDASTMNNYEQEEQQLLNSLDFSGANTPIAINANASNFIWTIVNALRTINGKIILLMTSVLGLGIIKMILNR